MRIAGMGHRNLRDALSRDLAGASSVRIERVIGAELAEDLEGLSSVLRSVGGYVAKAAPGALQGAATGLLTGGPAGALAGAVGGGLASSGALSALGVGGQAAAPAGVVPAAGVVGPAAQGVANPAALELLLTLSRPEVVDALIALALGKNGARSVPVAGTPVPPAAVTNLIQSLAEHASATAHASHPRGGVPRYLGEAVRRGADISDSSVRAEALLSLVHEAWDDDLDEAYDDGFGEDIDEAAEARDLDDIYRLGGFDDE